MAILVVFALLAMPAAAQTVAIPGTGDAGAGSAALQLSELEAQLGRAKERAAEWTARADALEQEAATAPERLAQLAGEIAELERIKPLSLKSVTTSGLEIRLLSTEQGLALAKREAAELGARRDRRSERRRELPEVLAKAKSRLRGLDPTRSVALSADSVVAEAQRQIAISRRSALEQEVRTTELELVSYGSQGKLLDASIERAELRVSQAERHVEELRLALAASREGEAERASEEALASVAMVESLDPAAREVVRALAAGNAELVQGRTGENGLLENIDDVSQKLIRAAQRVREVEADYERLNERVESKGFSESVGTLLHKTRSETPDIGMYRRFIRMRQETITEVQEHQIELREQLAGLSDIDALVGATVDQHTEALSKKDRTRLASVMRDLLTTKRTHLAALLADYEVYFQKLVDFDARQQELIDKTDQLLTFIDERMLWVRSGGSLHARVFPDAADALGWAFDGQNWGQLLRAVNAVFQETFYLSALGMLALLVALLALPWRVAGRLAELKRTAQARSCMEIRPTLEALGLSLVLVPCGPAVLAFLGWRLGLSVDATFFVRCISGGLLAAAWMWLTLEIPRQLLRSDGVAEAHFNWPVDAVRRLCRSLSWLAGVVVPLVFVIQVFELTSESLWRESIGRFALIAVMLAAAGFSHDVLRKAGAVCEILRSMPSARVERGIWRLLHFSAVGIPVALSLAAARGYYWTALQLGGRYHLSLFLLLMVLFLFQLSLRGSLVAQRRIAARLAREKRQAERAARLKRDPNDVASERSLVEEEDVDLAKVDEQTERLLASTAVVALGIGFWFLWVQVIPAFGLLDTVELWTATERVTIESTAPDGSRLLETEDRLVPFTIANLLLAGIVTFMTLALARNLPGLLEISVFRRLGTAKGERYAYATIAKYVVTLVGGVLAFNAVGIGWANIQWLVAAVGLGLGFGLQEIFANFVAGLIILFERPIRVGDTVTVGEIDGTVTKIRIRATWIVGFDRKELVVPNKEFVTSQLVNWSLSDTLTRVDIRVGVAYGSDTERVMRELHAVAKANELAVSDPRPDVFFLGFGDSSLDFELRVYCPDVEHRLVLRHELNLAVDRAFREAGIEIAFPQRDLHLRSMPDLSAVDPSVA